MASRVSNYLHFDERLQIASQRKKKKYIYIFRGISSKFLRNLHVHKNLIFFFFFFFRKFAIQSIIHYCSFHELIFFMNVPPVVYVLHSEMIKLKLYEHVDTTRVLKRALVSYRLSTSLGKETVLRNFQLFFRQNLTNLER